MDLEATALNVSTALNKAKDGLMSALQEKIGTVEDDRNNLSNSRGVRCHACSANYSTASLDKARVLRHMPQDQRSGQRAGQCHSVVVIVSVVVVACVLVIPLSREKSMQIFTTRHSTS